MDEPDWAGTLFVAPIELGERERFTELTTGWETPQPRRCECGADDCDAVIYMTWGEQDRANHIPRRWTVATGHTPRGGVRWRVIEVTDRFVIVEIDEDEVPMI